MPRKALELNKRRLLYQYILSNPGLHLRALDRIMKMGLGDLRHHLDYLEREGLITTATDGYRKTYYPSRKEFSGEKKLLALLRQSRPRTILLLLLNKDQLGFNDIRRKVGVSKSTLSFHLNKLEATGTIVSKVDGQRKEYSLLDKNKVAILLITYRTSFLDAAVDRALEAWLG